MTVIPSRIEWLRARCIALLNGVIDNVGCKSLQECRDIALWGRELADNANEIQTLLPPEHLRRFRAAETIEESTLVRVAGQDADAPAHVTGETGLAAGGLEAGVPGEAGGATPTDPGIPTDLVHPGRDSLEYTQAEIAKAHEIIASLVPKREWRCLKCAKPLVVSVPPKTGCPSCGGSLITGGLVKPKEAVG